MVTNRFFPGAQIDLHLSTLTTCQHFRAHVRATWFVDVRLRDPRSTHMFSHIFAVTEPFDFPHLL